MNYADYLKSDHWKITRTEALKNAGLTDAERAAAKKSLRAKEETRSRLNEAYRRLSRSAFNKETTAKEARTAVATYRRTLSSYRHTVQVEDEALSRKLSPLALARCLAMGIIDNGITGPGTMGMGPMRDMSGRMGRRGGMMGGRGMNRMGATPEAPPPPNGR